MLETIVKQEIIFYVMGIVFGISVLAKIISYITVRKMVKAASEIHKSNHRLMRLVKAKFEYASMVSDKVQNVEAFVEKYIYEYKVFGVRLCFWRSLPKKAIWMIVLLGVVGIFTSFHIEGISVLLLQYLQWTCIWSLFLALLHFLAEENVRLEAAKNYMVEYLENVCIHRYAKANQAATMEAALEEPEEVPEEPIVEMEEESPEQKRRNEQEMRIRAILEEFMA